MIESNKYGVPKTDKISGVGSIENTIVDSGLRTGQQNWQLRLREYPGNALGEVVSGQTLTVDVAGVTVTQAFSTDTATTLGNFATSIAGEPNIVSATVNGKNIDVVVRANKEVLFENADVTGTPNTAQLELEETQGLHIVPAVVVMNAEDFEAIRIDEASANVTYLGYAQSGTADSESSWKIKKIETSGTVTSITYPDGSQNFDYEWDDRATYTYS